MPRRNRIATTPRRLRRTIQGQLMNMKKLAIAIATVTVALASPAAFAAWTLNMTPGITAISRRVYDLHMIMYLSLIHI